jgi:uncharacterized repeat protein (TIGR03837 family)
MTVQPAPVRCDLFCRVVDNFGDAGVCWRLARQLCDEHGWAMRLVVDNLHSLASIAPTVDTGLAQQVVDGIDIRVWSTPLDLTPGNVVIEAFSCDPPAAYVDAMLGIDPSPLWLTLEYLATESWAPGYQWLPSPHPRLPLVKYFVFPGFEADLGVLVEHDLDARRTAALAVPAWRADCLRSLGADPAVPHTLFLFSYPTEALDALVEALSSSPEPVQCLLAPTPANRALLSSGAARRGAVKLVMLEPVAQPRFDEWLWLADLNIVRGEDSFVRAQLGGAPLIWHAYPQSESAHWDKLRGFAMQLDKAGVGRGGAELWWSLQAAWNRGEPSVAAWQRLWRSWLSDKAALQGLGRDWRSHLLQRTGLAERIATFCLARL